LIHIWPPGRDSALSNLIVRQPHFDL
jgi:hypothetical protein